MRQNGRSGGKAQFTYVTILCLDLSGSILSSEA